MKPILNAQQIDTSSSLLSEGLGMVEENWTSERRLRYELLDKWQWHIIFYLDVLEQNQADSVKKLVLPNRLINPLYGREVLNQRLREMATAAPSIEQVWEITKKLPSLSKLLSEERDNE